MKKCPKCRVHVQAESDTECWSCGVQFADLRRDVEQPKLPNIYPPPAPHNYGRKTDPATESTSLGVREWHQKMAAHLKAGGSSISYMLDDAGRVVLKPHHNLPPIEKLVGREPGCDDEEIAA